MLADVAGDQAGDDGRRERRTAPSGHARAELAHVALGGCLAALVAAVGERVDVVAADGVDVRGHPVVGELRDPAVAIQRPDADGPVEGGRPERGGRRVVACGGHQHAVPALQVLLVEGLERGRGQVHAGAAARRQVDDLRVALHRLLELHDHVGLEDPAAAHAADAEAVDVDVGVRCQAPDDASDERAVTGVPTQVGGIVELVVAGDAVQPGRTPVRRGGGVPAGVDDHDGDVAGHLLEPVLPRRPRLLQAGLLRLDRGAEVATSSRRDVDPVVGRRLATLEPGLLECVEDFGHRLALGALREQVAHESVTEQGHVVAPGLTLEEPLADLAGDPLELVHVRTAHEHAVGVVEVREVRGGLGVPGHLVLVGPAERTELVCGPSSPVVADHPVTHGPTLVPSSRP